MKDKSGPNEYINNLWNAGFFVDFYEHNMEEKTLEVYEVCEDYLRRKEEIIRDYG
jgi:hypothetical protein